MFKRWFLLLALSGCLVSTAFAEPKSGFGLALGPAGANLKANGDGAGVNASGWMGLADFQWGLADWFSLNFLLLNSQGDSGAEANNDQGWNLGFTGIQARFWLDGFFLGWGQGNARVGDGGASVDAAGSRMFALGIEGEAWSLQWVQVGNGGVSTDNGLEANASGILVGYRW